MITEIYFQLSAAVQRESKKDPVSIRRYKGTKLGTIKQKWTHNIKNIYNYKLVSSFNIYNSNT